MGIKSLKKIISQLLYILNKKQKVSCILLFILLLIGSGLETLGVSMILPFMQALMNMDSLWNNEIFLSMNKYFRIDTTSNLVIILSCAMVIVYIIKNSYLIVLSYVKANFQCKIQRELSTYVMERYMKRSYVYFKNQNFGQFYRAISADITSVYTIILQITRILSEILTVLLICSYVFMTDKNMAITIFLLVGFSMILITTFFQRTLKKNGERQRKFSAENSMCIQQSFYGIKEIKILQRSKFFVEKFKIITKNVNKTQIVQSVITEAPTYIIEGICITGLIAIITIRMINGTNMSEIIPQLASFAVAAFRVLPSAARITGCLNSIIYFQPGLEATYTNLHEIKSIEDQNEMKNIENMLSMNEILEIKEKITIDKLTWKYPDSKNEVLSDLTINISKGQSIAIIGESGAGKSTLADIILGLIKPNNGTILVDEKDIFEHIGAWGKLIGYVPQNIFLLDDTIRNNIAFGVEKDKIDDDAVWNALEKAHIKEFVETLPDKLDSVVGDQGIKFSGGQRQRFAIARALYHNPEVILLDEATSALDNETETAVMESIDALQGEKTLIIIAHRLTTIRNCDEIYEIINGKAIQRDKKELNL